MPSGPPREIACPNCGHSWRTQMQNYVVCSACGHRFSVIDGERTAARMRVVSQVQAAPPVSVHTDMGASRAPVSEPDYRAPPPTAGTPAVEHYAEIARRLKGGLKW